MLFDNEENSVFLVDISNLDDITNLCRLCLLNNDEMISIYEDTEDLNENTTTIFDELQEFSKTKLSNDPSYPSYVCKSCFDLLKASRKIRVQMKISQEQLMKYFKARDYETVENKPIHRKSDNVAPVELISKKGRFNLKEVIIIEEDTEAEENSKEFEGFLRNLGSTISAKFTNEIVKEKESEETEVKSVIVEDKKKRRSGRKKKVNSPEQFRCELCNFQTPKRNQLKYHVASKHSRKYSCDICDKSFVGKHSLDDHKAMHENARPYLCTVCGDTFNYNSALKYHMRKHTNERKYKCSYCSKAFGMSWGLKRHLTIHTGDRPYGCRYCGKGFASTSERKAHVAIHTGERPHGCEVCEKTFSKRYNLTVHRLSHSGPYGCTMCRRGFLDVKTLKVHYRMTHKLRVEDPGDVGDGYEAVRVDGEVRMEEEELEDAEKGLS